MFRAVRQIEDPEDLGLLRAQCFRYDGKREHVLEAFEEVLAPEFDSIRDELSLQFLGNLGIHRLFLLNLV